MVIFIIYYTVIIYNMIYNLCIDYVFSTEISHLNEYTYNTSGNNNYFDPVRDAANANNNHDNGPNNPGPNNPGPDNLGPGNVQPGNVGPSHTVRLANYLAGSGKKVFWKTPLRATNLDRLSTLDRNMSRIALETRWEYPNLFRQNFGDTRIDSNLIGRLIELDKNYDIVLD